MFIVDDKRVTTMRTRLGQASDLIDDDNYLPMFRNRQKEYPEEFKESLKIARKKKNPSHYFASIWSVKNLKQSLKWIRSIINRAKDAMLEKRHQIELLKRERDIKQNLNAAGRTKLKSLIGSELFTLKN